MDPSVRIIYYQIKRQLATAIEMRDALKLNLEKITPYVNNTQRELDEKIKHLKIQLEALKGM